MDRMLIMSPDISYSETALWRKLKANAKAKTKPYDMKDACQLIED